MFVKTNIVRLSLFQGVHLIVHQLIPEQTRYLFRMGTESQFHSEFYWRAPFLTFLGLAGRYGKVKSQSVKMLPFHSETLRYEKGNEGPNHYS